MTSLRSTLGSLSCNLEAGFRLAVLMPVRRLSFRIDVAQLLWLFLLSAGMDFISDWVRYGPDAYFSWYGVGNEIYSGGMLMLLAALLALAFRQRALMLAIPVLALSSRPRWRGPSSFRSERSRSLLPRSARIAGCGRSSVAYFSPFRSGCRR